MEEIRFYTKDNPYGEFSNFWSAPINLEGKIWPTTEHYFQAKKFAGTRHEEEIRQSRNPSEAARMGRSRSRPLREDWELVKDRIMLDALVAKFTQHPDLRDLLIGTGDAILIEHTARDSYWGDGGDGTGRNQLGKELMYVRTMLLNGEIDDYAFGECSSIDFETKE